MGKGARVGVGLGTAVGTGVGAAVGAGVGSGAEHASNTTITMDTTIRLNFDKFPLLMMNEAPTTDYSIQSKWSQIARRKLIVFRLCSMDWFICWTVYVYS